MATLKKYDLDGKEVGVVTIADEHLNKSANLQMVKDYLIAIRANARQWSAHTKTRAEVVCSGRKMGPQKGSGNARHGNACVTQYRGGGRVGGPRAKFDQHVGMNKKEKKAAVQFLLQEKIQNNQMIVLSCENMTAPKTKKIAQFLKGQNLVDRRILFVGTPSAEQKEFVSKSMRNIPKTEFMLFQNVSGYDVAIPQRIIVLESAVEQLLKVFEG